MTQHTRTQRYARERLLRNLRGLDDEYNFDYMVRDLVPEAWDTLEQDVDVREKKVQITLRLDESVAKFYRAMGMGYQRRINRILATYAQMKIARVRRLEEQITLYERTGDFARHKSEDEREADVESWTEAIWDQVPRRCEDRDD